MHGWGCFFFVRRDESMWKKISFHENANWIVRIVQHWKNVKSFELNASSNGSCINNKKKEFNCRCIDFWLRFYFSCFSLLANDSIHRAPLGIDGRRRLCLRSRRSMSLTVDFVYDISAFNKSLFRIHQQKFVVGRAVIIWRPFFSSLNNNFSIETLSFFLPAQRRVND